jgi:hypothetical protein
MAGEECLNSHTLGDCRTHQFNGHNPRNNSGDQISVQSSMPVVLKVAIEED